jgi:hypothetical protein
MELHMTTDLEDYEMDDLELTKEEMQALKMLARSTIYVKATVITISSFLAIVGGIVVFYDQIISHIHIK